MGVVCQQRTAVSQVSAVWRNPGCWMHHPFVGRRPMLKMWSCMWSQGRCNCQIQGNPIWCGRSEERAVMRLVKRESTASLILSRWTFFGPLWVVLRVRISSLGDQLWIRSVVSWMLAWYTAIQLLFSWLNGVRNPASILQTINHLLSVKMVLKVKK